MTSNLPRNRDIHGFFTRILILIFALGALYIATGNDGDEDIIDRRKRGEVLDR